MYIKINKLTVADTWRNSNVRLIVIDSARYQYGCIRRSINLSIITGVQLEADPEEVARFLGISLQELMDEMADEPDAKREGKPEKVPVDEPMDDPEAQPRPSSRQSAIMPTEDRNANPEAPPRPSGGSGIEEAQPGPSQQITVREGGKHAEPPGSSGISVYQSMGQKLVISGKEGDPGYVGDADVSRDWDPISRISGERTTPLGRMLGFTVSAAHTNLLCDETFINWPLPDTNIQVHFVVPPEWLTVADRIRSQTIDVHARKVVVAVGPPGKTSKGTVLTWVRDILGSIRDMAPDAEVFLTTALPRPPPQQMATINFNRNLSAAIKRWNRMNPTGYAKYVGWHKALLDETIPEDGVWERSHMYQIRDHLCKIARI